MKRLDEEWRDVVGYEGLYQASSAGRIRSLTKGGIVKPGETHGGYLQVCLHKNKKKSTHKVHRIIATAFIGDGGGRHVDHVNGIRTDNRAENLKWCTISENQWNKGIEKRNTSGLKGVSWYSRDGRWEAKIKFKMKQVLIGRFNCKYEAARAYDREVIRLHGGFARTNEMMGLIPNEAKLENKIK